MPTQSSAPMSAPEILDTYFLETRAKLLEIAATLDRLHRAGFQNQTPSDPRLTFIQNSLTLLQSQSPNRTEQLLRLYSIS